MKKVLISGGSGQLVTDIAKVLRISSGYEVYSFDSREWDITNHETSVRKFEKYQPDIYINGASYHVVEQININPHVATATNVTAIFRLSKLCNKYGTTFVNFSTNYVFDGIPLPPEDFSELEHYNENDKPNPVNLYGITKYAGEMILDTTCEKWYNFRVSGLFGKTGSRAKGGKNFPYIILDNLKKDKPVKVVNDQIINVTYTVDAANAIESLLSIEKSTPYGHYHLVNKGNCTWFDVAVYIAKINDYNISQVEPITTDDFYTNLKRPVDTALNTFKLEHALQEDLPTWQDALDRFTKEIENE
jgi:dTDP-4-dehydrorhamnose reductase|tara:strand:+ start:1612 stop:2520 length:909 start_codon:yes stop_codon:yes gene_type:complete